MKIIKQLYIINEKINTNDFAKNLYFSFDKYCFLGNIAKKTIPSKNYKNIETVKYFKKNLGEGYTEVKAIIKCDDYTFIRYIIDEDNKVNDVLIYSIKNEIDFEKYCSIFFEADTYTLDDYLENSKELVILKQNNHLKLVQNPNNILKFVGFEDWDFANKHQNNLDEILNGELNNEHTTLISHDGNSVAVKFDVREYKIKENVYLIVSNIEII